MIGFSIGFGCIPFLLLGELFPADQRSVLSSIAGSFNLGVMFLVIKTYHYLEAVSIFKRIILKISRDDSSFTRFFFLSKQIITTAGTFWMYSAFCVVAVIFVIFVVPETKGRDLDDIAKLFVKNRRQSQHSNSVTVAKHSTANETNGLSKPATAKPTNAVNGIGGNDSDITKL